MKTTSEKRYQTWAGWRRAAKEAGALFFEGDKDIAQAFGVKDPSRPYKKHPGDYSNIIAIGEWDGAEGTIYTVKTVGSTPGLHDDFPTKNPRHAPSRDDLYVEYVKTLSGEDPFIMDGQKFQYVLAKYSDGRLDIGVYAFSGDVTYGYEAFNQRMGIPRKQDTDPQIVKLRSRKNPLRRLPGESERDFMARCMSAEKKKFPRQDQRVAVCLSKARRNPESSHWFFVDSENLRIHTQGSGDHPAKTYTYESEEDFMNAIRRFERDGYEFIKDQAPTPRITKTRRNPLESGAQSPNATLTNRRAASMT